MRLTKRFHAFLILIILSGILYNCANQTAPTGGPKDETPPVVIRAVPDNSTTAFAEKRITLDFNEFVQLKDVNKQVIISPPMSKSPDLKLRGKSVVIDLEESLKPETTYTINFGTAIVDLTESNAMTDFHYIFSTGDIIDSLAIAGKTLNAFDLKPPKDLFTMLYSAEPDTIPLDSMPFKIPPYFLARNKEDGSFMFTNIKPGKYLLFSLKDLNSNYLFDLPNEEVAFLDTLISPEMPVEVETDSIKLDTFRLDTTVIHKHELVVKELYQLRLFKKADSIQRIDKKEVIDSTHVVISFRLRPQNAQFRLLNSEMDSNAYILERSRYGDTNTFWIKNPYWDTLNIEVKDRDIVLDTVTFSYYSLKIKKTVILGKRGSPLKITSNAASRTLELNVPFRITFNRPIQTFDFKRITIMTKEDTLSDIPFVFIDSIMRNAQTNFSFKEESNYKIMIPGGCFTDIYGSVNDTTEISFTTKALRDYGTLILNLDASDIDAPVIIQLLGGEKETVVRQVSVNKKQEIKLDFLKPGKYQLKAIVDNNRNGRRDTGNFSLKIQPESVYYLNKPVDIKSNWDVEQDWKIEK